MIAQRKALVIANFPNLIDQYALGYSNQMSELQVQSKQGFATANDLTQWVESWAEAVLPSGTFYFTGEDSAVIDRCQFVEKKQSQMHSRPLVFFSE